MSNVSINMPDDMNHPTSQAVTQAARVVHALARQFGSDVLASVYDRTGVEGETPGDEPKGKIVTFSFHGGNVRKGEETLKHFLGADSDMKPSYLPAAFASTTKAITLDVNTLAKMDSEAFDRAAYEAGHMGSIMAETARRQATSGVAVGATS